MGLMFKESITRRDFEKKLSSEFEGSIFKTPYGPELTLYYIRDAYQLPPMGDQPGEITHLHIGSWQKGVGWIFDYAKEHLKKGGE